MSLWRHGDFLRLWSAHTISQFGSQVTALALPLAAILVLDADLPRIVRRAAKTALAHPTGPVFVSLPFKLLLFVMVDGWGLIVRSLLKSFA